MLSETLQKELLKYNPFLNAPMDVFLKGYFSDFDLENKKWVSQNKKQALLDELINQTIGDFQKHQFNDDTPLQKKDYQTLYEHFLTLWNDYFNNLLKPELKELIDVKDYTDKPVSFDLLIDKTHIAVYKKIFGYLGILLSEKPSPDGWMITAYDFDLDVHHYYSTADIITPFMAKKELPFFEKVLKILYQLQYERFNIYPSGVLVPATPEMVLWREPSVQQQKRARHILGADTQDFDQPVNIQNLVEQAMNFQKEIIGDSEKDLPECEKYPELKILSFLAMHFKEKAGADLLFSASSLPFPYHPVSVIPGRRYLKYGAQNCNIPSSLMTRQAKGYRQHLFCMNDGTQVEVNFLHIYKQNKNQKFYIRMSENHLAQKRSPVFLKMQASIDKVYLDFYRSKIESSLKHETHFNEGETFILKERNSLVATLVIFKVLKYRSYENEKGLCEPDCPVYVGLVPSHDKNFKALSTLCVPPIQSLYGDALYRWRQEQYQVWCKTHIPPLFSFSHQQSILNQHKIIERE